MSLSLHFIGLNFQFSEQTFLFFPPPPPVKKIEAKGEVSQGPRSLYRSGLQKVVLQEKDSTVGLAIEKNLIMSVLGIKKKIDF